MKIYRVERESATLDIHYIRAGDWQEAINLVSAGIAPGHPALVSHEARALSRDDRPYVTNIVAEADFLAGDRVGNKPGCMDDEPNPWPKGGPS